MLTRTARTLLTAVALLFCLNPLLAQNPSATVVYQIGQVSIMDSGYLKPVSVGSPINQKQLIVTGPDGFAKCQVLSDGSTFEVYPNSKVVFRETSGDWKHLLNVFIGRVKVFIQHSPGVANPNNVTSPTAVISVRGTVFDVQVQDEDGTTVVSVDEGEVGVRNLTAPGDMAILHPGDSITVIRGQRLLGKQIDKGNFYRNALRVVRDTIYQGAIQRGPERRLPVEPEPRFPRIPVRATRANLEPAVPAAQAERPGHRLRLLARYLLLPAGAISHG